MRDPAGATALLDAPASPPVPVSDYVDMLRMIVDQLQLARVGNDELDRTIDEALQFNCDEAGPTHQAIGGLGLPRQNAHWSTNLTHALALLPPDYNFSLGHRDGVCWAWSQPNDRWEPAEYEARHDHPGGSGLVVAHTAALALTCAGVILQIRRAQARAV
jgi:hypothetical protein